VRLVDNEITQVWVRSAVYIGGYCDGPTDNSDLYIDGNTITSPYAAGIELRGSGGSNKVITCDNVVSAPLCPGGVCIDDSTFDGPYGLDSDADGVLDCDEELTCWHTVADVPERELGRNKWIWDGSAWITNSPGTQDPQGAFTMSMTRGCGCFQILDWLGGQLPEEYGQMQGHAKHGCSAPVIEAFIELSSTATE
jgi:hypothetical protein